MTVRLPWWCRSVEYVLVHDRMEIRLQLVRWWRLPQAARDAVTSWIREWGEM